MARVWTWAVAAAIVVATMLSGPASAAAAKLSLKADSKAVPFRSKVNLGGKLAPDAGISAGGHVVKLYEAKYPYKGSQLIAQATTAANGRYKFRVRPDYNTRYRTAVGDETVSVRSKRQQVFSFPRLSLKTNARPGRVFAQLKIRLSPRLPGQGVKGRRVYFYFRKTQSRAFVRKAKTRARQRKPGLLKANGSFKLPRDKNGYRYVVLACVDTPGDVGVFKPHGHSDCPPRIPVRRGRAASRQPAAFSSRSASPFIP